MALLYILSVSILAQDFIRYFVQGFLILNHGARPPDQSWNRLLWNGSANSSVAQLGTDLLLLIRVVVVYFCVVLDHTAGAQANPSNNRQNEQSGHVAK